MKKRYLVCIIVIVFGLMLIPIKIKNGNEVVYRAVLYNVTSYSKSRSHMPNPYEYGWDLEILGNHVYGESNFNVEIPASSENINIAINNYLSKQTNISNIAYNYVDSDSDKVIVGMVDCSIEKQNEFLKDVFKEYDANFVEQVKHDGKIEFRESIDVFVGRIVDADDEFILVEVVDDCKSFKKNDKVYIKINRPKTGVNDFYVIGNNVRVTFNGMINESNPPQIGAVKVELISL